MSTPATDPIAATKSILEQYGIIPDDLPSPASINPTVFFTVSYPGAKEGEGVLGAKVTKSSTQQEPEIVVTRIMSHSDVETSANKTYTLVMTDPDAPSRADPKFGQWRHWVITGLKIPGSPSGSSPAVLEKTAPSTTPYHPPGPPPGSGFHRYTFLLFEEPTMFSIPNDAPEHNGEFTSRRKWNAMKFAETYGMTLVGANFFLCEDS